MSMGEKLVLLNIYSKSFERLVNFQIYDVKLDFTGPNINNFFFTNTFGLLFVYNMRIGYEA